MSFVTVLGGSGRPATVHDDIDSENERPKRTITLNRTEIHLQRQRTMGQINIGDPSAVLRTIKPGCTCQACPECDDRNGLSSSRRRKGFPSGFPVLGSMPSAPEGLAGILSGLGLAGGANASSGRASKKYTAAARVSSLEQPSDYPLVVISVEAVLCAALPHHLSGGHTNVLSRTYLDTFMDYLLHPGNRWSLCFWSGSMKRPQAMEVLRMLKLPTGSAEEDERDGVLGLWTREDCTSVHDRGDITIKDLEVLWKELVKEEGIRWTQEDTVVITHNPSYMQAQPMNYIIAPAFHYKMVRPAWADQFLLMMIACLEDLTTESNFSNYIQQQKWHELESWTGTSPEDKAYQDKLIARAVQVCARQRLTIKFAGGN